MILLLNKTQHRRIKRNLLTMLKINSKAHDVTISMYIVCTVVLSLCSENKNTSDECRLRALIRKVKSIFESRTKNKCKLCAHSLTLDVSVFKRC